MDRYKHTLAMCTAADLISITQTVKYNRKFIAFHVLQCQEILNAPSRFNN